jgi:mRNA-degrading endonuclease RelE of RelBE toxin-antitoxin system
MTFKIIVAPRATRESLRLLASLKDKSLQGACDWYFAYSRAVVKLREHPHRWSVAAESPRKGQVIRQAFFGTRRGRRYRLLFTIKDDTIIVVRVRAPGQKEI